MYCQKLCNVCCSSSLASDFASIEQTKCYNAISFRIEKFLRIEVDNHIDFANAILEKQKKMKGKPRVYYSLKKYKSIGSFKMLTDISEHINLVRLMDYLGNVNYGIGVVGYCIFDLKYERALALNRESLDMIIAPSVCEE